MANPLDEDTGEFIELYNAGSDSVDLAGLVVSDGAQDDVLMAFDGGTTTLAPGGWALIVDAEYAGEYTLDAGVVLVTTTDSTLGNALAVGDAITLYEADGGRRERAVRHLRQLRGRRERGSGPPVRPAPPPRSRTPPTCSIRRCGGPPGPTTST